MDPWFGVIVLGPAAFWAPGMMTQSNPLVLTPLLP